MLMVIFVCVDAHAHKTLMLQTERLKISSNLNGILSGLNLITNN